MNNNGPICDYRNHNLDIFKPNGGFLKLLYEYKRESEKGRTHLLFASYLKNSGMSDSTNILIPYINLGFTESNVIQDLIIVNNPKDAERIASTHIKKIPTFNGFLYDSLISTLDKHHWTKQRQAFNRAFNVFSSLPNALIQSEKLAKQSVDVLWKMSDYGKNHVDINEFFLNETMKQLMIVMFGVSNGFQERTNKKIREALRTASDYAGKFAYELLDEIKQSDGPLSDAFKNRVPDKDRKREEYGNALLFAFAGHDSTGHTLTWLIYELCKNQHYQHILQNEVDTFWVKQKNKPIEMNDFKRLPFMTRFIMETLRLWPALANGTYRELTKDDYVQGTKGKVKLVAGTLVQIPNWVRHRNKELWGDDANVFNPLREFKYEELWNGTVFNFYNPGTKRFSPFTYGPRDCIGKNFAQIEMRLILLHLIKHYTFSMDKALLHTELTVNHFTLGPRSVENKDMNDMRTGMFACIQKREKSKL